MKWFLRLFREYREMENKVEELTEDLGMAGIENVRLLSEIGRLELALAESRSVPAPSQNQKQIPHRFRPRFTTGRRARMITEKAWNKGEQRIVQGAKDFEKAEQALDKGDTLVTENEK